MTNKYISPIFLIQLLCLLFCLPSNADGQTLKTVEIIEQATQMHLDEGVNMMGYTSAFYIQMDSLLNVVYNKMRKTLPPAEKEALKKEQLDWLKARDNYFRKLYKDEERESEVAKSDWGELEYLIVYRAQAEFVKDRVIVLINRLNGSPAKK